MNSLIYALILLMLSLGAVVVRKTYYRLPPRELKRRAERHDATARALYRAVAYGSSLRTLLWLFIGLTSAGGVILLVKTTNSWLSLLVIAPLLWIIFSAVPAGPVTRFGTWLTVTVTPVVAWLLNYLHPLLSRGGDAVQKRYEAQAHTKLYERDDLIRLIERQQDQADSRFTKEELEIAKRALEFSENKVTDVMTPRKKAKTVLADDSIGPVLINEIHESGQDQILVRESAKGPFVGSLEFSRLGLHSKGPVRDSMNPTVYYLHEKDSLGDALHAFFVTNHPVFVIVNSAEEFVGVITVATLLQQLFGHVPGDDFDNYSDPEAVAGRYVRPKKSRQPDETIDDSDETPVKTDE